MSEPPGTLEPPVEPDEGRSVARRRFFRTMAGDAVRTAVTLAGAASALRETTDELTRTVLGATGLPGMNAADPPHSAPVAQPVGVLAAFRVQADRVVLVDQRRLPAELAEVTCASAGDIAQAIREGVVQGAPVLGQVAAIGLALAAADAAETRPYARRAMLHGSANALANARSAGAAVRWAIDRMLRRYAAVGELCEDGGVVAAALWEESEAIVAEAARDHAQMACLGVELLPIPEGRPLQLLTHGYTGPLAGGQVGTALGVVQALAAASRDVHVYVGETRPRLQGARLTAWELGRAGIAATLLADSAAGWLLATGRVDAILVGADWIAANGDTAHVVGTYPLAVLAARHGVPFYVVAPTATFDAGCPDAARIPIEMGVPGEVGAVGGVRVAPVDTVVLNPVLDVTPAELVTAFVTEHGVLRAPYGTSIAVATATREARRGTLSSDAGASAGSLFASDYAGTPRPAAATDAPARGEAGA